MAVEEIAQLIAARVWTLLPARLFRHQANVDAIKKLESMCLSETDYALTPYSKWPPRWPFFMADASFAAASRLRISITRSERALSAFRTGSVLASRTLCSRRNSSVWAVLRMRIIRLTASRVAARAAGRRNVAAFPPIPWWMASAGKGLPGTISFMLSTSLRVRLILEGNKSVDLYIDTT